MSIGTTVTIVASGVPGTIISVLERDRFVVECRSFVAVFPRVALRIKD